MTTVSYINKSRIIDSLMLEGGSCFTKFEKSYIFAEMSETIFELDNYSNFVFEYTKKAIENDFYNAVFLENKQNQWIRLNCPEEYNFLVHLSDSVYFSKYKSVNLELAFMLRFMVRNDQRVRIQYRNVDLNDETQKAKLEKKMSTIDRINEELMTFIFDEFGYPGYTLLGGEHNAASLIFHHMSIDFQTKYIHLLENAIYNKELYEDLKPLIDKVLYNKFGVTIYGTHYSNKPKEEDPQFILKYRKLLNLKEISWY